MYIEAGRRSAFFKNSIDSVRLNERIIGYRETLGVVKKLEYFVLLNFTFICSIAIVSDLAERLLIFAETTLIELRLSYLLTVVLVSV